MTFGERLQIARKDKGYTQEQVAEFIGVAKSTYTGYEKNNREPDVFKIKRLVEVLGVNSSWLLGIDANDEGLTSEEFRIIKKYRQLDPRGRAAVMDTVEREFLYSTSASRAADAKKLADDVLECMSGADLNEPVRKANE
ncbi:helix-turn-helix domain-containing protein [Ruthenibacterium lactatiformans]|uniref:helix-turn-helix domain-containing protein n=1 Tax=Ruthenibacterium lactatiformans TaxID=1550024 RepID=UPI0026720637|nr:helix-turn-helix transcriptional regulator [Ruthenibacterium lactatiformans]